MTAPLGHPRLVGAFLTLALLCLALGLLVGCGGKVDAAPSFSPSPKATFASPRALSPDLPSHVQEYELALVRSEIRGAYQAGRAGARREDPSIIAALRKSFASNRSIMNGASRVVLIWVDPYLVKGYHHQSATHRRVSVFVWAEGDGMTTAPGFSGTQMNLSRSSPNEPWHVDGTHGQG